MKKFQQIVMLGYSRSDLGKTEWARLEKLSKKVVIVSDNNKLYSALENADCLLVKLGAIINKTTIDKAAKLRYIGMFGTGYGRIDTGYAAKKGITVCNIAGYSREGVAELVFGMLIDHIREITRAKLQAAKGDYSEATYAGIELKGKNFGIVGLGSIGGRIAEIAHHGFGANVLYWSKHRKMDAENQGILYRELDDLIKNSDFISINLAYVPQTKNFLNRRLIQQIKPGAVVINLAPMELFDFDGLNKRLAKNDITFILDHADELTLQQAEKLSKYKNCTMYPPIGYVTREATEAKKKMFIDNIEKYLKANATNKVI